MDKNQIRETIARRAALEIQDGNVVNLGIGLPTLIANYIPNEMDVILHSENGLLGIGPEPKPGEEDKNFINAGGGYISYTTGASSFDSATSFVIIRGGHVNITFLGALQVDEKGNLEDMGKMPGQDEKDHKSTFVTILGVEEAEKYAEEEGALAKEALAKRPFDSTILYELTDLLLHRKK